MVARESKPKRKRLNKENIMISMQTPQAMQSLPDLPLDENIALYGRQSSLFQVENRTASYDYQIEEQRKHILVYGWKEHQIIEYFQDFAVSGTLGIGERVGITQLTEDLEAGLVKAIYVFLEDRLFRDRYLENVVKFARICDEHHIIIITTYRRYYMWIEYDREAFIEACKQAWKAFDTQINKRMLPMRVHKSHQGMYDSRAVNIGYTCDRGDKHSPTYRKYIPEEGQIESVKNLFNKLIAYGGDLVALAHELEDTPGYHFPMYKDPLSHSKCTLTRITGGYRIQSMYGLKCILRNPVYIGTWKTGDKTYENNHAAIIDRDVWNLAQALMDKRKEERRPIPREKSEDCVLESKEQATYSLKELEALLVAIKTHWDRLQVSTLNGLALLFCKGITPTPLSARFWKIEIEWELWGTETWLGWSNKARHIWEPEEIKELRKLVEQDVPKDQWMELLPDQTRWGINTAFHKHFSSNPDYRKLYGVHPFRFKIYPDRIDNLSMNDRRVAEQYGIDLRSIDIDESHVFFIDHTEPATQLEEEAQSDEGESENLKYQSDGYSVHKRHHRISQRGNTQPP